MFNSPKTIINLTSHDILIFKDLENTADIDQHKVYDINTYKSMEIVAAFPKHEGSIPRCRIITKKLGMNRGIPIIEYTYGPVVDLPEPKENTWYIVSARVANIARQEGRTDLLIPSYLVTDQEGKTIGCQKLSIK